MGGKEIVVTGIDNELVGTTCALMNQGACGSYQFVIDTGDDDLFSLFLVIRVGADLNTFGGSDILGFICTQIVFDSNTLHILGSDWLHWMTFETVFHNVLISLCNSDHHIIDNCGEGLGEGSLFPVLEPNRDVKGFLILGWSKQDWHVLKSLGDFSERSLDGDHLVCNGDFDASGDV